MVEAHRIEAEEKSKMVEAAERQVTKYKELMRLVVEYKENLAKIDVDYTPIAHVG
jgi:hypothetical protein